MSRLLERLSSTGLRWRVAGMSALVILACLGIAFVAVYNGTGSQLRGQTDRQIASAAHSLTLALRDSHARSPSTLTSAASRYVSSRPFSSSSTLLFVTVPGAGTATNRPELFLAERPDNGESAARQAGENRLAARLRVARPGYSTLPLHDVGNLRLLVRAVALRLVGGRALSATIGVGQPLEPVSQAQRGVARAFVLAAVLAGLAALLGGYLVGSRASRPLRRIARIAERVDAGDLHPRIHSTPATPREVRVLADAFDHMLDRLTDAFASQREFVADASHELRTPLTVIRGQIEVLCENPNPSVQDVSRVERLLQAEVQRVDRLVEDLLLLAELEQTDLIQREWIDLRVLLAELRESTMLLGERRFSFDEAPDGALYADPNRLTQALRNLLTNAIKQTTPGDGRVQLRVERRPGNRVAFIVEDDGPGIPAEQHEHVFDRFHRIDPARDRASGGAGLGLAIVQAIAKAHDGSVQAGAASIGGARFELELPGLATSRVQPLPSRSSRSSPV